MQKVGLVLGMKRGLPKAMTDFQITYKCIVEQKGKGAGRTAQHIYDSDGKLLASLVMKIIL